MWTVQLDKAHEGVSALSNDERARADRFVFPADRRRFVASRAALRRILGQVLEIRPSEVAFAYGPNGKPSVQNEAKLEFNLAHSGELALIALCYGIDVGVDVEQLHEVPKLELVVDRFFTPAERASIGSDSGVFLRYWTRKEAVLKLTGKGLSLPLNTVDVSWPGERSPAVSIEDATGKAWQLTVEDLKAPPGYVAGVAVEGEPGWRVELRAYAAAAV